MRFRFAMPSDKKKLYDDYRKVAMDAMMGGDVDKGEQLLSSISSDLRLTKPQAKLVAKQLLSQGDTEKAMRVLSRVMGKEGAEREMKPAPTANIGDVLYTSYGYEQTNIDFVEVVAVKGSMATVREIQKRRVGGGTGYDMVIGDRGAYVGPPKRVRVQKGYRGDEYQLKIGDHHAWLWDGKPKHETAAGYGH